jgi:hypothetical protein
MSGHRDERDVLELLESLRRATADGRPSPAVEQRVLAEFHRLHRHAAPETRRAHGWTAWPRLSRPAWLAAAASIALLLGAAAAWRLSQTGTAGGAQARQPLVATRLPGADGVAALSPGVVEPPATGATVAATDNRAAGRGRRPAPAARDARLEFVAWPGAGALPPFESGELVRTELPVGVLSLLGIEQEGRAVRGVVVADVIVGQDRMPRAVRVVR